jgi:pyridinium-3,5-biscarboxylic acid mononucleotide synthase
MILTNMTFMAGFSKRLLISKTSRTASKEWLRSSSSTSKPTSTSSSNSLTAILRQVQSGQLSIDQAQHRLQTSPDETLQAFANLDHARSKRTGFPEAVFAAGKTAAQVASILDDMARHVNDMSPNDKTAVSTAILATRVTPEHYQQILQFPLQHGTLVYHEMARIICMTASTASSISHPPFADDASAPTVVVACAGTTDMPVAEEAAVTLTAAGCKVDRMYDVGVAGLHRILRALPRLQQGDCVIVCAGMDGALPSVVGGLVSVPVIAVPTSVGYGAAFGGVSALLTMLNSCAPGVGVVNIDNGFGAAALAYKCVSKGHGQR